MTAIHSSSGTCGVEVMWIGSGEKMEPLCCSFLDSHDPCKQLWFPLAAVKADGGPDDRHPLVAQALAGGTTKTDVWLAAVGPASAVLRCR